MRKYIQSIWTRILAVVLCMISVLGMVAGAVGMWLLIQYPDKEEIWTEGRDKIMENYALYCLDHVDTGEIAEFLADTNMHLTIELSKYDQNPETGLTTDDALPTIETLFSDIPEGAENTHTIQVYTDSAYQYYMNSMFAAFGSSYYSEGWIHVPTPVTGYVFDAESGLFYYRTDAGLFCVEDIRVTFDGKTYDYCLTMQDGKRYYYNSYYQRELDTTQYENWDWVVISMQRLILSADAEGNTIQVVTETDAIRNEIRTELNYWDNGYILYSNKNADTYILTMYTEEVLQKDDFIYEWYCLVEKVYALAEKAGAYIMGFLFLLLAGMTLLILSAPSDKERLRFFHKIPVGVFTVATAAVEVGLGALTLFGLNFFGNHMSWSYAVENCFALVLGMLILMLGIGFVYLANIVTRFKTHRFLRYSELYYLAKPFAFVFRLAKENTSLFWKGVWGLSAVSIVEFLVILATAWEPDNLILCFLVFKIIEIPVMIYILSQMKQLQLGAQRIAAGNLSAPINTSKMLWEFKKHGENINQVSNGIALAVEEQMKSERFKTELITNVSHDIKTPLTSIINYVDLIKKEEITNPTLCEYIEVLDRQTARLKKLIEDLMEASKASTGNLTVHFEECDAGVLLTQAVGEFEDRLEANGLEVVVSKPEEPVLVIADGRHLWRVLDNLMNNVCKYSQANTRVYVSLETEGATATITFKNISKEPLNIPSEQLLQRFVRGDSSRHTEGSGLGLSIAQSLTELMNGSLKLDIDGDLFKVTLKFNAITK